MLPADFLEDMMVSAGNECGETVHVVYDENPRIGIRFQRAAGEVTLFVSDYLKDIDEYVNGVTGLRDGVNILGAVMKDLVHRTAYGLGPDPEMANRLWEILGTDKWRNDHINTYLSRLDGTNRRCPAFKTLIHFIGAPHHVVPVNKVNSEIVWFEYCKSFKTLCVTPDCKVTDDQALAIADIINDIDDGLVERNIITELRYRHPELLEGLVRRPEGC